MKRGPRSAPTCAAANGASIVRLERGSSLGRIELGGRSTVPLDRAAILLWESDGRAPLELEARWLRPIVLRVQDAQTRAELDGVDVLVGAEERSVLSPIGGVRVCTDARSPVELPLPEGLDEYEHTERVWARARGYGWASMEVPRGLGGEFALALRGCGTLRVEVNGVGGPLSPFFRLRDTAFEPTDWQGILYDQQLVADARFELDSIPAGAYLATIEVGHAYRYPRILDEREVLLQAGTHQHVKFDVASFPRPALVEVRGVLVVPVEWDLGNMGLYLELVGEPTLDGVVQRYLDQSEMDVLDPGLASFAWSFGELQPGSYEARFNPLGTSFAFEAPATSRIHLEVPPPATLEVSVVNDRTGQLVLDARVSWMPSREDLESGGALNGAGLIEPGRFSLRSPAGEVEIWCWSKTHRFRREILTLAPGHQQFELRMSLAEGITLSILDGESALPLREVELDIREIDGDGEGWLMDDEHYATEGHCVVTHPGLYRIEVTRMPASYQLPPAADVMVPEATFVPVSLQSRR